MHCVHIPLCNPQQSFAYFFYAFLRILHDLSFWLVDFFPLNFSVFATGRLTEQQNQPHTHKQPSKTFFLFSFFILDTFTKAPQKIIVSFLVGISTLPMMEITLLLLHNWSREKWIKRQMFLVTFMYVFVGSRNPKTLNIFIFMEFTIRNCIWCWEKSIFQNVDANRCVQKSHITQLTIFQ